MATEIPIKYRAYHLYNRGNHREVIGVKKNDYDLLYRKILLSFNIRHFDLISFCIMPNHFHILVAQTGDITISEAMHRISFSYTKIFNSRNGITGHLLQGTYQRKTIEGIRNFNNIIKYIERNPSKLKDLPFGIDIKTYPWKYQNEFLIEYYKMIYTLASE